jgi:hypothetical protein
MDNFQVNTGVNTVPRKQPMSPDPIGLTMPPRELDREHANLAGSTFNPKVAGSIPARPHSKQAACEAFTVISAVVRTLAVPPSADVHPRNNAPRGASQRNWSH